tara:strand:+ start:19082 stop:20422 length:1341 start_codon:yes stop_codon:yes gene_type:complete
MDTLAINAALCMIVVIFQLIDRMSNPLIFLLSTYIVVYNSLRILTLIFFDDFSRTLEESGPITIDDFNYAFLYFLLASILLYLGLIFGDFSKSFRSNIKIKEKSIVTISSLLLVISFITFLNKGSLSFYNNPVFGYILRIFNIFFIQLILIPLYSFKSINGNLKEKDRFYFWLSIITSLIVLILIGNRKHLIDIIMIFIFSQIVFQKNPKASIMRVVFGIFLFVSSLFLYDLSTYLRYSKYDTIVEVGTDFNYKNALKAYLNSPLFSTSGLDRIFDRVGFLDITINTITYSDKFHGIFNPIYYSKSVIDDLSPGLVIFNSPLAGQIKNLVDNYGIKTPTFYELRNIKYSSRMITGYAEVYILSHGYFGLFIYFIIGYLFSLLISKANELNTFDRIFFTILVVNLFFGSQGLLFSFGFDWMLSKIAKLCLFYFIIRSLLVEKETRFE